MIGAGRRRSGALVRFGQFGHARLEQDDDIRRIPPPLAFEHEGKLGEFAPQLVEARTGNNAAGRQHRGGVSRRR